MKKIMFLIFIVLLSSCVKEDFQKTWSNAGIYPEYAIPVGNVAFDITDEFSRPPSPNPGDANINYFEGEPYIVNAPAFFYFNTDQIHLGIDENTTGDVESCTFHILIKNAMPTEIGYKLYLQSGLQQNLFSLLDENHGRIPGAQTDAKGKVLKESIKIVDIPLTKREVEELKNVRFYRLECFIATTKPDGTPAYFLKTSLLQLNIGLRIKLKLNRDKL